MGFAFMVTATSWCRYPPARSPLCGVCCRPCPPRAQAAPAACRCPPWASCAWDHHTTSHNAWHCIKSGEGTGLEEEWRERKGYNRCICELRAVNMLAPAPGALHSAEPGWTAFKASGAASTRQHHVHQLLVAHHRKWSPPRMKSGQKRLPPAAYSWVWNRVSGGTRGVLSASSSSTCG